MDNAPAKAIGPLSQRTAMPFLLPQTPPFALTTPAPRGQTSFVAVSPSKSGRRKRIIHAVRDNPTNAPEARRRRNLSKVVGTNFVSQLNNPSLKATLATPRRLSLCFRAQLTGAIRIFVYGRRKNNKTLQPVNSNKNK